MLFSAQKGQHSSEKKCKYHFPQRNFRAKYEKNKGVNCLKPIFYSWRIPTGLRLSLPTNLEGSIRKQILIEKKHPRFHNLFFHSNTLFCFKERHGRFQTEVLPVWKKTEKLFPKFAIFTVNFGFLGWFVPGNPKLGWLVSKSGILYGFPVIPRSKFLPLPTSPCHSTALHCHANDGGCAVGCSRYLVKRVFFWRGDITLR